MILNPLKLRRGGGTERTTSDLPVELLTGHHTDDTHKRPRLRVDVAQTGFFEGREFRGFWDGTIAAGATQVIKFVLPINMILFSQELHTDASLISFGAFAGGTEGGVFTELTTVYAKNQMLGTPVHTRQVVLSTGGTHTGGTQRDIFRVAADTLGSSRVTGGGAVADERGLAPGTYYVRLNNYGSTSAIVTYKLFWEERP
jgi:hypothetical protein